MCLAVPGRILSISGPSPEQPGDPELWRSADVDFGGVRQRVSLACLPEARVGDQVLVHVGFALSVVEEDSEDSP
jgi:hydrogenase expression/formation protein HypC